MKMTTKVTKITTAMTTRKVKNRMTITKKQKKLKKTKKIALDATVTQNHSYLLTITKIHKTLHNLSFQGTIWLFWFKAGMYRSV